MTAELWLVHRDVLDANNRVVRHLDDAVHHEHRIAVRQNRRYFLNIHQYYFAAHAILCAAGKGYYNSRWLLTSAMPLTNKRKSLPLSANWSSANRPAMRRKR